MFLQAEPGLLSLARAHQAAESPGPSVHGDVLLAGDSCSMWDHVKPQLRVPVWACQEAGTAVGPCLASLSILAPPAELANSCIFHQKWFLETTALSEGGGGIRPLGWFISNRLHLRS